MVPDVEIAIVAHREQEVATVRRDARPRGATINGSCIEHHFAWTELTRLRVEGLAIDIVLHLFVALIHLRALFTRGVLTLKVSTAVIEHLAIGCPRWEYLKLAVAILQVRHLVSLHIIDNDVALLVAHFHLVGVNGMEVLTGLVGSIDNEVQPRVPGRINASREDRVVAHVHLLQLTVIGDNCTTQVLTGMELHALRVVVLIMVTIDALAVFLETAEDIVVDNALVIVLQAALIDGQCLVGDERRGYQTIADIRVDGVWRHKYLEGFEARPLITVACIDINGNGFSFGFLSQCVPLVDIGLSVAHDVVVANSIASHHLVSLSVKFKTQRCHIYRYCHLSIVRIDGRQFVRLRIIGRN